MIAYDFSDEQLDAIVAYAKSLGQESEEEPAEASDAELNTDTSLAPTENLSLAEQGAQVAVQNACNTCHSVDGSVGIGPSWKNLYGSLRTFTDGTSAIADEAYLRESILNPTAKVVASFIPSMPAMPLTDDQIDALVAYAKANSSHTLEAGE